MTLPHFNTLLLSENMSENSTLIWEIALNRPKAWNALNAELIAELNTVLSKARAEKIGAVVLTGSEKVFAAGADVREMAQNRYPTCWHEDFLKEWDRIPQHGVPIVAAVAGLALGGGCELALMADVLIASDTARFGQPEIKLGVMPGAGGTQRLVRRIGMAKATDLCLTGRTMDAAEAERCGLVSRVVPQENLLPAAREAAFAISGHSKTAVQAVKTALKAAEETGLEQGLRTERQMFHSLFGTEDQIEGMEAFLEKRPAVFKKYTNMRYEPENGIMRQAGVSPQSA
jgi:enoyl-CoA hydratase